MAFELADRDILLVIDVQNDFCPGGALAVPDGDAVVPVANRMAEQFPNIALTQDWHPADHSSFAGGWSEKAPFETVELDYGPQVLWPDHCVQGTPGAEFHPNLSVPSAALVLRKGFRQSIDSYSAFFENDGKTPTGLTGYLRERGFTRVFMLGLATDFCVKFSALDARKQGFEAVLIDDGCRAIDLEGSLAIARDEMAEAGVSTINSWEIA